MKAPLQTELKFNNDSTTHIQQVSPTCPKPIVSRCVLLHGDCSIESDKIESASVDLILTDLPYGLLNGGFRKEVRYKNFKEIKWDVIIPPSKIFEISNRILRQNGRLVLFAQEPLTSRIITASPYNLNFNYKMFWDKKHFANALGAKKAPVSYIEEILVYTKRYCHEANRANPVRKLMQSYANKYGKDLLIELFRQEGRYTSEASVRINVDYKFGTGKCMTFQFLNKSLYDYLSKHIMFEESYEELQYMFLEFNRRYRTIFNIEGNSKSNILRYSRDREGYHPTQKPFALLKDLIETFSNKGDLVVDLTMGSGSTGVAALKSNRHFIGIEKEKQYFDTAVKRCSQYSG